jgi:SWIM/SEC-C metal-binding protein
MGNRIADIGTMRSRVEAEGWIDNFASKKTGKLGSVKNPAIAQVQSEARRAEVTATFAKHGWHCRVSVEPDKPEEVAHLERLLHPQKPTTVVKKAGRNEPCVCGSGKKSKHCCAT